MATLCSFPCKAETFIKFFDCWIERMAQVALIYKTERIAARPPQIIRFPRNKPLSRFKGATPTSAAISLRFRVPSSGRLDKSVMESTGPTPGALLKILSFSRQTGLFLTEDFANHCRFSLDTSPQLRQYWLHVDEFIVASLKLNLFFSHCYHEILVMTRPSTQPPWHSPRL